MTGRLSGKVCIVTGSGGSMGRATALTFAPARAIDVTTDEPGGESERSQAFDHEKRKIPAASSSKSERLARILCAAHGSALVLKRGPDRLEHFVQDG